MKSSQTWGCPVFILYSKASEHKLPKWYPRSRLGIYLCHSPCHASTVSLVLNPLTLHVSPQYHVIFDDEFSTVPSMVKGTIPPNWERLVKHSSEHLTDEEFTFATSGDDVDPPPKQSNINDNVRLVNMETETQSDETLISPVSEGENTTSELPQNNLISSNETNSLMMPTLPNLDNLTNRRSTRKRIPTEKAKESFDPAVKSLHNSTSIQSNFFSTKTNLEKNILQEINLNTFDDGTVNYFTNYSLLTNHGNDVFTFRDMLKEKDAIEFMKAMQEEINKHEVRSHWKMIPRTDIPPKTKVIQAIWEFKRKGAPSGEILCHKARLCAHGGQQQWGENYWETFAPVVNWLSVRTMLVLSLIHDMNTR